MQKTVLASLSSDVSSLSNMLQRMQDNCQVTWNGTWGVTTNGTAIMVVLVLLGGVDFEAVLLCIEMK